MALMLGIDTGGTFTDAVIYDDAAKNPVLAKAKSLTTRHDLSIGIGLAARAALEGSKAKPEDIAMVSVSTTLATNALVEGQGGRAALIFIGFDPGDLGRGGLAAALGDDPVASITGGHDPSGHQAKPLDTTALSDAINALGPGVEAFAVVARFGSRNPAHEIAARDLILSRSSAPVTCGHELSARLNGPKRALTCLLNARLVGMISDLITATTQVMQEAGLGHAPLMLVRGDGALVSAEFARTRPIETILSGPAASLVGARALTGADHALVSDIGGTTTDIALLRNGQPQLSPTGATVGGFETMVEAVDMATHGLGGDSEVTVLDSGLTGGVTLGPRRAIPLCLLAHDHGALVLDHLSRQASRATASDLDARFAMRNPSARTDGLGSAEEKLLSRVTDAPELLETLLNTRADRAALTRLVARGILRLSTFTPTDAAHILNIQSGWSQDAARLGASLLARRRAGSGMVISETAEGFAEMTLRTLRDRSVEMLLTTALKEDGLDQVNPANDPLLLAALNRRTQCLDIQINLSLPVIGLGASAPAYYPEIADRLGTRALIPDHADVANAVGAVAGQISMRQSISVIETDGGGFSALMPSGPETFSSLDAAKAAMTRIATELAHGQALAAGAEAPQIRISYTAKTATIEGQVKIVEGEIEAIATGRPGLKRPD